MCVLPMCLCIYIALYVYMYWKKLAIYKQRKKPSSHVPLLQRTTVNTWLLFFPFTMSNIYWALTVCQGFAVPRASQAVSDVNVSSYGGHLPPSYTHVCVFLIFKAKEIILFCHLAFLHTIESSFHDIKYSSTESFITAAWCFIAGRFHAPQTGVRVPLRAKPWDKL